MNNKNKNDSLGQRIKQYESVNKHKLIRRMPTIIRIDGKAFHSFTKKAEFTFPFSNTFHRLMRDTTFALLNEVQCAKVAYFQSDEISILLSDRDRLTTEQWFGGSIQKITSVSASIATSAFNFYYLKSMYDYDPLETFRGYNSLANFDSRVFQLPEDEVNNYFIW